MIKIPVTIRYEEAYIPPRCRKPRYEEKTEQILVGIRSTTYDKVKLAFVVKSFQEESRKVIQYEGRLYRQFQQRGTPDQIEEGLLFVNRTSVCTDWNWIFRSYDRERGSKENYLSYIYDRAKTYLIVNGDVYERCYEPYYSVTAFGLGGNHGGTGFFVHWADDKRTKLYGWSAIDTQEAIEGAVRFALYRGDTNSEEYIRQGGNGRIDVMLPSCIKRNYENPDVYVRNFKQKS